MQEHTVITTTWDFKFWEKMIIQEAHDLFQNITAILRNLITHTYIFVILTKNDENLPGIEYLLLRF